MDLDSGHLVVVVVVDNYFVVDQDGLYNHLQNYVHHLIVSG